METNPELSTTRLAHPGDSITVDNWIAIAAVVLRILQEVPALVEAVALFWTAIGGSMSPPALIENAVHAAINTTRARHLTNL